jgi:uncharacterized protein YbjQ (UPF0145 family)
MFLVNTEHIPGRTFEMLGYVSGSKFSSVIGSSDVSYAMNQMVNDANKLGADAIVNIRCAFANDLAYVSGTAVKFV